MPVLEPIMRFLVLILAMLAAGKVVASEFNYRNSMRDAVISGHRERAAVACHRDGKTIAVQVAAQAWSKPRDISLAIGNPRIEATAWEVDSPQWLARYRNPNILISVPAAGGTLVCSFDVVTGATTVRRG